MPQLVEITSGRSGNPYRSLARTLECADEQSAKLYKSGGDVLLRASLSNIICALQFVTTELANEWDANHEVQP